MSMKQLMERAKREKPKCSEKCLYGTVSTKKYRMYCFWIESGPPRREGNEYPHGLFKDEKETELYVKIQFVPRSKHNVQRSKKHTHTQWT